MRISIDESATASDAIRTKEQGLLEFLLSARITATLSEKQVEDLSPIHKS